MYLQFYCSLFTAASCVQPKNSSGEINLKNIKVKLCGDLVEFGVFGMLIHKEWKINDEDHSYDSYNHDFAMLKLNSEIEYFKECLRPICVTQNNKLSDNVFGYANVFNQRRIHNVAKNGNSGNHDQFNKPTKLYLGVSHRWETSFTAENRLTNICGV